MAELREVLPLLLSNIDVLTVVAALSVGSWTYVWVRLGCELDSLGEVMVIAQNFRPDGLELGVDLRNIIRARSRCLIELVLVRLLEGVPYVY